MKLNNYLLRETDAKVIFQDASVLNMTGKDYAWIVTEQALEARNVPTGILGLKLVNATSEESHIKDSV
jgi:ionotropic glutamate receptor NMDA 1